MKTNEGMLITNHSLALIFSNVKEKIAEKQIIEKKLTPFLLHQVASKNLKKNLEGMVKKEEKNSFIEKSTNEEPVKVKKDNMNPKNISQYDKKTFFEKYSIIQPKNVKKTQKRFHSALQTSREKNNKQFLEQRPSNSTSKMESKEFYLQFSNHQKSTNTQTEAETGRAKSEKTHHMISMRRFSKKESECIKLNEKNNEDSEFFNFEEELRDKKLKREEEKEIEKKQELEKVEKIERLKERFLEKYKNSEEVSFDFDGSILNLTDNQLETKHKEKYSTKKSKAEENENTDSEMKCGIPLVIETKFKITQNSSKNLEDIDKISIIEGYSEESLIKLSESGKNSVKTSFKRNLHNNMRNEDLSDKNKQTLNNSKYEKRLFSQKESLLHSTKEKKSFFESKSLEKDQIQYRQGIKDERMEKLKLEHLENEKDFTNNFQRQFSTIPYIDIKEGICYKEELDEISKNDEPLVQYATISKQISLDSKHSNKKMTGNRTFRSFYQSEQKPTHSLHQTFSVFTERQRSVQSARVHESLKTPSQKPSKIQNSVKLFSAQNPFIENEENSKEKQTEFCFIPSKTINNFFFESNLLTRKNSEQDKISKVVKNNKNENILDLKAKNIMKQKIQKNLFEVEEIK